jgi:RNA polymerase sigma-70 factor, ECF subfamily
MGIAQHVTLEWMRDQERQRRALETAAQLKRAERSTGSSVEEEAPATVTQARILQAINDCPERYRLPLMMRYVQQMDYAEIASTLELSSGQVKGLLYRGTQMLRERLSDLV